MSREDEGRVILVSLMTGKTGKMKAGLSWLGPEEEARGDTMSWGALSCSRCPVAQRMMTHREQGKAGHGEEQGVSPAPEAVLWIPPARAAPGGLCRGTQT